MKLIALPDSTPLVTLRLVFQTGAAFDPPGRPGTARLTAQMLACGGSRTHSYKQILDAFFPLAVSVQSQEDKEMIVFSAETHRENLEAFYGIFRGMLLDPGWRGEDFERLRDDAVNHLAVMLRGQNDEEFGKEVLQLETFAGHPYGWNNAGTIASLEALRIEDLKEFYAANFRSDNLIAGIGGGYPPEFPARLEADFLALPDGWTAPAFPQPIAPDFNSLLVVEKPARSVAISLGYPIGVRRGHPDYPALALAVSCLGQHRMSSGRLFTRMRQLRGLNYGDYAYIEHFPGGMFTLEPGQNLVRTCQMFELWIRPVEAAQAHFALRLALFELQRFVEAGISEEEFERGRSFLSKYSQLLLKTKSAELGYAIDSHVCGTPLYTDYMRDSLAGLTCAAVNSAIQRHLRAGRLRIVMIAPEGGDLEALVRRGGPSPIEYNASKPQELLAEDAVVSRWPILLGASRTLPAAAIFA